MSERTKKWIVCVTIIIVLLPMLLLRDFTPNNELRYLSITDEALREGRLFAFTHYGVMYADKPPLYLWLLMACRWLTGGYGMLRLSVLTLLPAFVIVRTMNRWIADECGVSCRLAAMVGLLSTALFTVSVAVVRMDMLMCMFIVLALRAFYTLFTGVGRVRLARWLFPLWLFLGVFTKGALGFFIPVVAIVVFLVVKKQSRRMTEVFGWRTWLTLIVLFGAWFGAVYAEGGAAYLNEMLLHQTAGRIVNAFHHQRPFYFYAVSVLYCSMPWTPLIIGVVIAAFRQKVVKTDVQKLFITTAATTFVLLSCVSSKLDIYLLPMYPFLIYFTAMFLPRFIDRDWCSSCMVVSSLLLCAVLPAYAIMTGNHSFAPYNTLPLWITAMVLTATGLLALAAALCSNVEVSARLTVAGFATAVFLGGFAMSGINRHIGYGEVCREALSKAGDGGTPVLVDSSIHHAADMDVYLGDRMKLVPPSQLWCFESAEKCSIITKDSKFNAVVTYIAKGNSNFAHQ